tara:strand:+ start:1980 stop:2225 length:246 start_codon:yes stop_codon:yes gene_type:complete
MKWLNRLSVKTANRVPMNDAKRSAGERRDDEISPWAIFRQWQAVLMPNRTDVEAHRRYFVIGDTHVAPRPRRICVESGQRG